MQTSLRFARAIAAAALLCAVAAPAEAQVLGPAPEGCTDEVLPSGARIRLCIPRRGWNGDLLVWAHGYVSPLQPLDFYSFSFPEGFDPQEAALSRGFAFATTSYRRNGLAILPGVEDVRQLVEAFRARAAPAHTYLFGVSEGGLVTTLSLERYPELYSGGLAMCGPIGSFREQLNYFGDFRALFDYFFPGVLPGSAIQVPPEVTAGWFTVYRPRVQAAIAANPGAARQLVRTAKAAFDPDDPETVAITIVSVLQFNVFATNDAVEQLGGNPYDNRGRLYVGSRNDLLLNLRVERFAASTRALRNVAEHETTGDVSLPLVTLHTTLDPIVPYWHEPLYLLKVDTSDRGVVVPIPVHRYGHCALTNEEILGSLKLLLALGR
ncbi:serine aminopeptidase domain-containing protein [Sorangium sp. So ce542]|uniref:serine aminopeptidase domain-containing protein n=1 Tax=Sorangium sp. So ce542 TaxID=3133316 RepID=UPI003F5F04F5